MHIQLTGRNVQLSDALRNFVLSRLKFAFDCVAHRVELVRVRLSDVNGPHGGVDKVCHIDVFTRREPPVILVQMASDMYVAVDKAVSRAKTVILRRLDRHK